MQNFWLVVGFFLLLTGGNTGYGNLSETPANLFEKDVRVQFSEEFEELSPGHVSTSTTEVLNSRSNLLSPAIPAKENSREYSKSKTFFSVYRFIEPGLSLADILFPFHVFL